MARRDYKPHSVKRAALYTGLAGATVVSGNIAQKKLRDRRRMEKHQYIWDRPNGEQIPLLGFDSHHIETLKPALQHVDNHLKSNVNLNLTRISHESPPPIIGRHAAGLNILSQEQTTKDLQFWKTGSTKGAGKPNRQTKYFSTRFGTNETKGSIRIAPGSAQYKRVSRRAYRSPQGLVIHEIGHSIGNSHVYNPSFRHAFDWKVKNLSSSHEVPNYTLVPSRKYNPKAYHRSAAQEDVAESFRYALKTPTYVGKKKKNKYPVHKEKGLYKVHYTQGRDHYLRKHFLRAQPISHEVKIRPTSGIPYRVKKRKKTR